MKVYAKHNLIVESFNARNEKGNKLRKSRGIKEGEAFEVKRQFTATGGATHGSECLEIAGPNKETYQVYAKDFVEEKREQKQTGESPETKRGKESETDRLLRCIREIIEDPKNEEFTFGSKKERGGYLNEQDEGHIRLEKLVEGKKVFVQGWIDTREIYPAIGSPSQVKTHTVIYFHDFADNEHKKWVYPSKNKSDEFLKRKIRSIMREWVTKLAEIEGAKQGEEQEMKKETAQLLNDLKDFNPQDIPDGRGIEVKYGSSKKDLKAQIRLSGNGEYTINLSYRRNNPSVPLNVVKELLIMLRVAK